MLRPLVIATLLLGGCRGKSGAQADAAPPDLSRWRVTVAPGPAAGGLPEDAEPMAVDPRTGRILCSSFSGGLFEIEWPASADAPSVLRTWTTQDLGGHPGKAIYAGPDTIYVNVYSKGLAKISLGAFKTITPADGLINADLLALLATASGDLWVAGVPGPFNNGAGGGVQILRGDRPVSKIPFSGAAMATVTDWIEVPERRSVFATTADRVVEIKPDGTLTLLSTDSTFVAIARQPGGTTMGVAGSIIGRWDGSLFSMAFSEQVRPLPTGATDPSPVGLVIDARGVWFLLFHDAVFSAVAADGTWLGSLDHESGIPASPNRLLALRDGGRLLVGSRTGMVVLTPGSGDASLSDAALPIAGPPDAGAAPDADAALPAEAEVGLDPCIPDAGGACPAGSICVEGCPRPTSPGGLCTVPGRERCGMGIVPNPCTTPGLDCLYAACGDLEGLCVTPTERARICAGPDAVRFACQL
jgi:hypothetical protein